MYTETAKCLHFSVMLPIPRRSKNLSGLLVSCFKEPLLKQCNLLSSQEYITSGSEVAGDMVSWNQVIRKVFAAFVKRAEEASTNNEKRLTYEYLAVFLISSIDGLIVAGHN